MPHSRAATVPATDTTPTPATFGHSGTITIALFAGMADALGRRHVELAWSGGTAAMLRRRMAEEFPAVAALVSRSAVAIGAAYVTDDAPIPPGAEAALIPPVSGG